LLNLAKAIPAGYQLLAATTDYYYKEYSTRVDWATAKAGCEADGAHLFMWKKEEHWNALIPLISEAKTKFFVKAILGSSVAFMVSSGHCEVWTGLTNPTLSSACADGSSIKDADCEGILEWADGTPLPNPREAWFV